MAGRLPLYYPKEADDDEYDQPDYEYLGQDAKEFYGKYKGNEGNDPDYGVHLDTGEANGQECINYPVKRSYYVVKNINNTVLAAWSS